VKERQNGGGEISVNRERQNRGKITMNILLQNPQTSPAKSSPSLLPRPGSGHHIPGGSTKRERQSKGGDQLMC